MLLIGRRHRLPQLIWDRLGAARDLGGLAHERYDFGVFARCCHCLAAFPLAVVHDLGPVEAHVEVHGVRSGVKWNADIFCQ